MRLDRIAAEIGDIGLAPDIAHRIERIVGIHEKGELAEIEPFLERQRDRGVDERREVLGNRRRYVEGGGGPLLDCAFPCHIEGQLARNDWTTKFAAELGAVVISLRDVV